MLDFTRCSTGDLDIARTVVSKLTGLTALDPMNVMILGAECRNILHSALGHTFPLRRTNDVDIAIALSDWNTYDNLVGRLRSAGHGRALPHRRHTG